MRHSQMAVGGGVLVALGLIAGALRSTADEPRSVRQLDLAAQRARGEYLKQLGELASEYDKTGETEKAQAVLRQILQIAPEADAVKDKLDKLESRVFEAKSSTVDVDVARGWVSTGLMVSKDQPIRFEAEGSYKFIANVTLGPDGFATADLSRDLVSGIECGKLMGLIVAPPKRSKSGDSARPGIPFAIGTKLEMQPSTDGLLLLRVNIPSGTNSNGKVKVTIRGNIRSAQKAP